jgi:hypothetical protein
MMVVIMAGLQFRIIFGLAGLGAAAAWLAWQYVLHDYHKVTDEIKPGWDLSGALEDIGLLFQVGYATAQGDQWPKWKPGSEFKRAVK